MVTLRCNGKHGTCQKRIADLREDNVIEYANSEGFKIIFTGSAIIRCKCGHLSRIDVMDGVFSTEIKKASFITTATIGGTHGN